MKTKKKSIQKIMLFFICSLVIISIILTTILLLFRSSGYFNNEAKTLSEKYTYSTMEAITFGASASYSDTKYIADKVSKINGFDAMDNFGDSAVKKYDFTCLQFLNKGEVQYRYGESVGDLSAPQVQNIINTGTTTSSDVFVDLSIGTSCIAIYSPVRGNDEIDGVLAYKVATKVFNGLKSLNEKTLFYALSDEKGSEMETYISDDFKKDTSHNAFTYLLNVSNNKEQYDKIVDSVKKRVTASLDLMIDGQKFIVSTVPLSHSGTEFTVICVFSEHDLLSGPYSLYDRLLVAVVLLVLLTVATIFVSFVLKRINERRVTIIDELDPQLGCNSFNKFVQEAQLIIERNKFSKFAICYISAKNYAFFTETYGRQLVDDTLMHISTVLKKSLSQNETFGHIVDDRFVYMIHYTDIDNLSNKIKIISALISYFDKLKQINFNLAMLTGVFLTKEANIAGNKNDYSLDINDYINRAKIACIVHAKAYEKPFIIYDSSIGTAYTADAEVESKMREALKNREFRLFFQPKYNIPKNNIDSAEVLVRWYDEATKTYQSPGSFIRIFETNGFIVELDHYVFRETCVFLHEMKQVGQKTVPLSINVSRVTTIDSGFIDYYKSVKEEYGIPDGYITLEFTETFAYDSYKILSEIVLKLKKCGFLCSIDDFGVGYSALNILKEMPVDEVKIDKALLDAGSDIKKDMVILKGIFEMSNGLGLKLIQEGVETKEQLDYIHKLGCNIIQGYYYSKPLFTTDFINFINDSKFSKLLIQ